jgi:hypothetical protein
MKGRAIEALPFLLGQKGLFYNFLTTYSQAADLFISTCEKMPPDQGNAATARTS